MDESCGDPYSPYQQAPVLATPAERARAECEARLTERGQRQAAECHQWIGATKAENRLEAERLTSAAAACTAEAGRAQDALQSCTSGAERLGQERDGLQAALAEAIRHPGAGALAAFPAGAHSLELGLFALAALTAGGLLGWGSVRRARPLAGTGGALLALLAYGGSVALLSDTRWTDLFLALLVALLLLGLALLAPWALRPAGPAPPRRAGGELDAAEEALLERWPEGE